MKPFYMVSLLLTIIIVLFVFVPFSFAEVKDAGAGKAILVNVDEQILQAVENYKIIYEFDVVTGRPSKETTTGKFYITRKYKDYTSKKYKSPMPYSMFFSEDGKAIHGTSWAHTRSFLHTYVTESVGSQGCVGLREENAKKLFEWAPVGTRVIILDVPEDE